MISPLLLCAVFCERLLFTPARCCRQSNPIQQSKGLVLTPPRASSHVQVSEIKSHIQNHPEHHGWLANYLVVKRICTQPNFHDLYLELVKQLEVIFFYEAQPTPSSPTSSLICPTKKQHHIIHAYPHPFFCTFCSALLYCFVASGNETLAHLESMASCSVYDVLRHKALSTNSPLCPLLLSNISSYCWYTSVVCGSRYKSRS